MIRFSIPAGVVWILLIAGNAVADIDLELSYAVSANGHIPASLYSIPDGNGYAFTESFIYGNPNQDATITVHVMTIYGYPFAGLPAEDIWLQTEDQMVVACTGGACADAATDADGIAIFQTPLQTGGFSNYPEDRLQVYVLGNCLWSDSLDIYINSPDINGDGTVALGDIALFAEVYLTPGKNDFYADFWWDGSVNIQDLVLFAQGYGASCP